MNKTIQEIQRELETKACLQSCNGCKHLIIDDSTGAKCSPVPKELSECQALKSYLHT